MIVRNGPDYNKYLKLVKELSILSKGYVKVGILSDGSTDDGVSILEYAIYNEYGTSRIPARPFLREATERPDNQAIISRFIEAQVTKVVNSKGEFSAKDALTAIGEFVRGRIILSIKDGKWAPNSPSTIKGKNGRTTPLIDKGDLIRAIEFEVVL